MVTRRSVRAGSLLGRLHSILKHVGAKLVDRPLTRQETDWEPEDHREPPTSDSPVVDHWDSDPVGIGATDSPPGSRNSQNPGQNSPSRREGETADRGGPRLPKRTFELIQEPTTQRSHLLSVPAPKGQNQPAPGPTGPSTVGSPQNDACSCGTQLKPPEQGICTSQTLGQAQHFLNISSNHDYEPEIRRTQVKLHPTGAAAGRLKSLGATSNSISGAFQDEDSEFTEAADAELWDHETSLGADLAADYFDYDPDAHQPPWSETHPSDTVYDDAIRRAREKAASIASIVEVTNRREQEVLFDWLTELFLRLKHPATFQSIKRIALEGITADLLQRVVALWDYWMERREWWPGRYERSREVRPLRRSSGGLTWAIAVRICRTRADYALEDMIDEDWFEEWLNLPRDIPGDPREIRAYHRFAAYVDAKVSDPDAELLNYGLTRLDQLDDREQMGEDRGWWRRLPRYEEDIRFGFNVLTPFRDGFGVPGYPENQERTHGEQSES
jgi:hypothetical protein